MQNIAFIIALLVSGLLSAQSNYEMGMSKAFELWSANKHDEASHMFERVASVETNNWLPSYYAAQLLIMKSFGEKDKEKLTSQLKKAQAILDNAKAISNDNPEILVMQAILYTSWVAYDGATYGMQLSGKISALYNQARQMAPDNPRVVLSKAEWDMGSARFFGQDTAPFCKDLEQALGLFTNFKPESEFHPSWGQERAAQLVSDCKS